MKYNVEIMITQEDIESRVHQLAKVIEKDFAGKEPVFIGLLKGSVLFMSDLVKQIDLPLTIDFLKVSSYHGGTESTGVVQILQDVSYDLTGKEVIIVEDIIDTGLTLKYVKQFLHSKAIKSLHVCTLLDKPSRRKVDIKGNYVGFEIPDEFVIGYGLDYAEKHRNLPYIGKVVFNDEV
jgi:hypoxanthine phosphoribosyltransferase